MAKRQIPAASEIIKDENVSQQQEQIVKFSQSETVKKFVDELEPVKRKAKHVQFHAGVDQMGSSLSVTDKQADIYVETAGVLVVGKTSKNTGKKFFVPFTNIRGVTLL